jgi:hypothetical protein
VTLGIMQPYFFPYIGYFQLLAAVDRFVVYDDVTFIKQGWINRNRMLINGDASFFTIPLAHKSSGVAIRETTISDAPEHRRWSDKLLKSFENAYRRAPHFAGTFPLLERVLATATTNVAVMALESVRTVAQHLDIRTPFVETSASYGNAALHGEDRVIAICRAERADRYLNVSGGQELYSRERFRSEGIELRFIQSKPIEYAQFGGAFVPWLSIVDVLMFNPVERVREFLAAGELA